MFERLQKKWKVSAARLALILLTFAIGGSLTGYVGKKLMNLFAIDQRWLWIIVYIIVITLLWPMSVLLISVLTGQFTFFKSYLRKMGVRMKIIRNSQTNSLNTSPGDNTDLVHLAIFASGAGSNAQKIIDHFKTSSSTRVALMVCNNPAAGVLKIAEKEKIPALIIGREQFFRGNGYLDELRSHNINFIVLAGFLWKIPQVLIDSYRNRIVNIHPALLPKFGGKGMYGNQVHSAVLAAGEKESGITIHYVDEYYDNGDIIKQVKCAVLPGDTPDSLAERIHNLEHEHYPAVIAKITARTSP